ncbi:MAG TPA: TrbC/VirB2 family protein [Croceibacterium sp.]|nr:TrbC/VirB2 family protein [Solirubrobacterales bacterium]HYD24734.1 TrbC/VirB2 family protein [Croceibacterium sp.]
MAVAPSLFAAPPAAVLPTASDWVTGTLFGGMATILCVLAIAFVGLMLMTGRFAIRDGARVVIGCFVLLGAPLIAAGLRAAADEAALPPVALVPAEPVPADGL